MIERALARLARIIAGASVRFTVPLDPPERQRVYFGNHTSHLDFVLIWSALPAEARARTRPVAGADYWMRGRVRRYLATHVFHAVVIERGAHAAPATARHSVETIAAAMGDDASIIVFPEGTRSPDGSLLPFRSGLYHLCQRKPGLELIPVYLDNLARILPKGEVLPVPLLSRVTFGAPQRMETDEGKREFLTRMHDTIATLREG